MTARITFGMRIPGITALLLLLLSACGPIRCSPAPEPLDAAALEAIYRTPLATPDGPLVVFHLGHSLVGRDMPAMVEQLAGAGHRHFSQLGWGTTLKAHFEPDEPIAGFETENAHPRYRDARETLGSGDADAFVMTEMVELRDAIRYFDSAVYAARWSQLAREGSPDIRIYLYETWHPLDDPEGWLERLDLDLDRYWKGEILARAMAADDERRAIHVIPAGQVMARFVREIEARGSVDGIARREDLFSVNEAGEQDMIHLNDLGAYLVALTHYAVLYHRSPVGLPHALLRADGAPATAPGADAARLMQEVVQEVVTSYRETGVAQVTAP